MSPLSPARQAAKRRSNAAGKRRLRGIQHDLGRCEGCRGVYAVTPSGAFRMPHLDGTGSRCRGCDLPVSVIVTVAPRTDPRNEVAHELRAATHHPNH